MTAEEFRDAMDALRWTDASAAAVFDVGMRTVQRWKSGKIPIPDRIAEIVEARVKRRNERLPQ